MQLVVYCKKCSTRNVLNIWSTNRGDLKMKNGNNIEVICKKCKTKMKYPIDNIQAEQRLIGIISFVGLILCAVLLVYFLWDYNWHKIGSVYLIPVGLLVLVLIYTTINKEATKKVRNFNRS